MTPQEAFNKINGAVKPRVKACFEMGDLYLFTTEGTGDMLSVSKTSGEVKIFNPIFDSKHLEFSRKKEIKTFKFKDEAVGS